MTWYEAELVELNRKLNDLKRRMYWVDAIDIIAGNAGLELLTDGGDCRIYRTASGELINCWIDAPDEEDNGFDDQVEWYTEGTDEE